MVADLPPIIEPARASPFHPDLTNFQIAWDSTSLGELKECPRKYYYTIVLGWRTKASNVHLTFGQLYHKGMEVYDHFAASLGKLEGGLTDDEHNEGIRRSLLRVMEDGGERRAPRCTACSGMGHIALPAGDASGDGGVALEECELCGGAGTYGEATWHKWESPDPYKNAWTLSRSIVNYLDTFRASPLVTLELSNGKPAVELSFNFEAFEIDGEPVSLCGHFDRMVIDKREANGSKTVHDRKTTKSQLNAGYWAGFSPHNQFSLYTAGASLHYDTPAFGVTVDAAQVLIESTKFARHFIPFPPAIINEWMAEAKVWITLARRFAEANNWPRNDKSCNNFGGCPFRKVCSKSASFRQDWLEADFIVRKWNPLETRGDI